VVTEHASYLARLLDDPAARDAYGEVVSGAAAVLCVGEQMRADLVAAFPEHADRFAVLPNAVEVPAPRPSPPRPGLPGWVCVGSLIPRKRPETVLEAFAAAAREQDGMSLAFVGSGPLETALRARAQELGLGERVRCVGSVSHREALELIGAADVLVHLADHETFGMSVAEALGLGTPVIVTASAGPSEVLRGVERAAGELLAPGATAADVAAAWRGLVARQGELDGSATRRHILEHYGPVAVGERLAALYARVQTRQEQA
jgi:glycogen(starch) synthase